MAGGTIDVIDLDEEGEIYGGADVEASLSADDRVHYHVSLRAIEDGLVNAANGDFVVNDSSDFCQAKDAFEAFADAANGDFDASHACALWQVILFGEVIYC